MKTFLLAIVFVASIFVGLSTPFVYAQGNYRARQIGHDVSWPNCRENPPHDNTFGIIGVTGGLVFHPNPCLFSETHWFNDVTLYMNTGYAGKAVALKYATSPRHCSSSDEACLAYNFGYNAGMYALNYADSQYVHTNEWWLDVETENSWSTNNVFNRESLVGMITAIQQHTLLATIGFYSYPGQWKTITNNWQNGYPNWVATGDDSLQKAVSYCSLQSFNGGPTWLSQYTTRFDNDYVCK